MSGAFGARGCAALAIGGAGSWGRSGAISGGLGGANCGAGGGAVSACEAWERGVSCRTCSGGLAGATGAEGAVTSAPHLGHWSLEPAISGGTASLTPQEWQVNFSSRGFKLEGAFKRR